MFAYTPRSLVEASSERITVHRPKPLLPSNGLFQEQSILYIIDTQRTCSVSLTTDSSNLCSLHTVVLQNRSIMNVLNRFLSHHFSAPRAHREPLCTRSRSSSGGCLHKASQLHFDLHRAPHRLFGFFSDSTTQLGSATQGPNTHLDGCLLFFSTPTETRVRLLSTIYSNRLGRACLLVSLFIRLFVCLFRYACFFFSLFFTVKRPRLGVFYLLYFYTINSRCRNISALASSGRQGERGVQQNPGRHQELPRLCRQEQGVVSRIQEQAARLPASLQQGRIRNFSSHGPAIIIYSGQHRDSDA